MRKSLQIIVAIFATIIGFYPITFFLTAKKFGLLSLKSPELLSNQLWNLAFYGHIVFGGFALLIGWLQFSKKLRSKNSFLHRTIGKCYIIAVFISGICSLFLALQANGGLISISGFFTMGVIWLATTFLGLMEIKKLNFDLHENYMMYSYASCFSGVTLRVWLPLLVIVTGSFNPAYRIVAWLCWVPNLVVAYIIIRRKKVSTSKYINGRESVIV